MKENIRQNSWMAWGACFSAGLFSFYNLMQFSLFNSISFNLLTEFHLNSMQFSFISGVYLSANAFGLFLLGPLYDKYSTKPLGLIFVLIAALGSLAIALSSSMLLLTLMRFLQGLAGAASLLLCTRLVIAWFPEQKGIALGIIIAMALAGGIIGNATFSYGAELLGWRSTLIYSSVLGFMIFILMLFLLRDPPCMQQIVSYESRVNRNTLLIGCQIGLLNLPIFVFGSLWGNVFLQQVYQVSYTEAAEISGYLFLGIMIGGPISGWLSDQLHERESLQWGGTVLAAGIPMMLFYAEMLTVIQLKWIFLSWGMFSSVQIIGFAQLSDLNSLRLLSTGIGIAAFMENIVGMAGQWLFGILLYVTWDGAWLNNAPLYHRDNYLLSLGIFILGYILCTAMWMLPRKSSIVQRSKGAV